VNRLPQGGFTLPEVLVSVAVFGIAGTALVASLLLTIRTNRVSNGISTATTLAQSYIEYLRAQSISAGTTTCPSSGAPTIPSPYSLASCPAGTGCTLGTAGSPVSGTRTVSVVISWNEADTGCRSVQLQSYVTY
jgi:prepilin-type N-terminal cleavage/methylation domain-containing protein